jgi:hypothetical protein
MEKYIDRPYSQLELQYKRKMLYKTLNLGNKKVWHKKTRYFYLVKQNGRKEKEMIEKNCCDVGNCSVTWKLLKTPKEDKTKTLELINDYMDNFYDEPIYLTPYLVNLEHDFYNWLYK